MLGCKKGRSVSKQALSRQRDPQHGKRQGGKLHRDQVMSVCTVSTGKASGRITGIESGASSPFLQKPAIANGSATRSFPWCPSLLIRRGGGGSQQHQKANDTTLHYNTLLHRDDRRLDRTGQGSIASERAKERKTGGGDDGWGSGGREDRWLAAAPRSRTPAPPSSPDRAAALANTPTFTFTLTLDTNNSMAG